MLNQSKMLAALALVAELGQAKYRSLGNQELCKDKFVLATEDVDDLRDYYGQ